MKVDEAKYSIAEIADWLRTRDLVANHEYQRSPGLWPTAAKSYFIDTILREFPFPKVYFHEVIDRATKKPWREIVDGQQRLTTIVDFLDGKFALGRNAGDYQGMRYGDLPDDLQGAYLAYPVSVDVIRNADRSEILQMFRRMNAYTLPLSEAEKRHSEFFGAFKDWVNRTLDAFEPIFVDWGVLSSRQVVRMLDAEFIADLALATQEGIVSTSPAKLRAMYRDNDLVFSNESSIDEQVSGALEAVLTSLSAIQGSYATKLHVFYSLLCALMHNRFGLPEVEDRIGLGPIGEYFTDAEAAVEGILRLAAAHEGRDSSQYEEYVMAASEGGNRAQQRAVRLRWLCLALRGQLA